MSSGKDRRRQQRHQKKVERNKRRRKDKPSSTAASIGRAAADANVRFTSTYATPDALASVGPLLIGQWLVPDALEKALVASGMPVPAPVVGHLLIDTGASTTCISASAAAELGLTPTGMGQSYGAHGCQQAMIYTARLAISIQDGGNKLVTFFERPVMAVPDLEKGIPPGANHGGAPIRLVGLLGRDYLRHVNFSYRGPTGQFVFEVIPTTMEAGAS